MIKLHQKISKSISKRAFSLKGFLTLIIGLTSLYVLNAQEKSVKETILEKDSIFWNAYNECDIAKMENFLAADLEFYHDKSGVLNGSDKLNESMEKGLCSTGKNKLRREAVPGTVAVFPLKDKDSVYGAIITGEHLFYLVNAKTEQADGKAKFSNLWLLKDGKWKMHRVFSYDHQPAPYSNEKEKITLSPAQLQEFAGNYLMPSKDAIIVKALEDKLELKAMGKMFTLYPDSENSFFTEERDLTFTFSEEKPRKLTIFEANTKVAEATCTE
ncbi:DUF4440 domain-containing protein [Christiangramia fulva]|uniref:DUF4440 domain-containing protein n=1 Tax=Christiangramia fulva TaxID=2126553 RepID=A0A2R3Z758_9FLAO|nr:nuclear transport factor 2 family protein [Christiangramia fulva]AVR46085.1 DUF4440 domain-containing protein [Christiangramia fulva]